MPGIREQHTETGTRLQEPEERMWYLDQFRLARYSSSLRHVGAQIGGIQRREFASCCG